MLATLGEAGTAAERGGNKLHGSEDFRTDNGSSQGLNLALTGLFVPSSLDSGDGISIKMPPFNSDLTVLGPRQPAIYRSNQCMILPSFQFTQHHGRCAGVGTHLTVSRCFFRSSPLSDSFSSYSSRAHFPCRWGQGSVFACTSPNRSKKQI